MLHCIFLTLHRDGNDGQKSNQNFTAINISQPKQKDTKLSSHGHSHGGGGDSGNLNMRGVFLHVMADALGSVIVIISALIMWKTDWAYKNYVDPGKTTVCV